ANTAGEGLFEREQSDPPVIGKLRRLYFFQILDDGPEIGFSPRCGDARLQSSEQMHSSNAFNNAPTLERDRKVDIPAPPRKTLRHDPDHRADFVVQTKLPSHHSRIAAELALPETVAEHRHRGRVSSGVLWHDRPSHEWRHPHDLEGVKRAVIPAQALR